MTSPSWPATRCYERLTNHHLKIRRIQLTATKCEVTFDDTSTPIDDPILKNFQLVEIKDLTLLGPTIIPTLLWKIS